jgi:hypothetical protein
MEFTWATNILRVEMGPSTYIMTLLAQNNYIFISNRKTPQLLFQRSDRKEHIIGHFLKTIYNLNKLQNLPKLRSFGMAH